MPHVQTAPIAPALGSATTFNLLAVAAGAIAALLPIGYFGFWFAAPPEILAAGGPFAPAAYDALNLTGRFGAAALGLAPMGLLVWGLLRVRTTFLAFAAGNVFSARAIAGLRDFAIGVGGSALSKPVVTALLSIYLTWNAPEGQKQLVIQLGSDTLLFTLFAATFLSATWAMHRAAVLAEENSQFI